jgi:hydroxymethylpyrimidine/phosphomethylpyrimidine kinase
MKVERSGRTIPAALTIGGSDGSGCAGVLVDLRVFVRSRVFGTAAITAVTAQTDHEVVHVEPVPPDVVAAQIRAAFSTWSVAAVKTGMLWSGPAVAAVAGALGDPRSPAHLVVDPVLASTSGTPLVQGDALATLKDRILPRATLVTPNLGEASTLLGRQVREPNQMSDAARDLSRRYGCAVLLKGGHLAGDPVDLLWHAGRATSLAHPRATGVTTRGTGCMLSAAITARLALGDEIEQACRSGVELVSRALESPVQVGDRPMPDIEGA